MTSILHAACRIQAAVKAYNSMKEHADREKWKAQFEVEKSKSIVAFKEAKATLPRNQVPTLHPLIVALAIVLQSDQDFSLITEDHPDLELHKYYDETATFPDLSPFLPSKEDCWWEDLAAQTCARRMPQEPVTSKEPKELEPPAPQKLKAPAALATPATPAAPKLTALSRPLATSAPKELTALDQPPATAALAVPTPAADFHILIQPARRKISKGGDEKIEGDQKKPRQRKRKAVDETAAPKRAPKRRAPPSQAQAHVSEHSDSDGSAWEPPLTIRFELKEQGFSVKGASLRALDCHNGKVGCSLMPRNASTGKVNRHSLSAKAVYNYRLAQLSVRPRVGKKLENPQDENPQAEPTGSAPSPSTSFAKMTLDGMPSRDNTPVPEQDPGTSSSLLPVASVLPQVSPPSFQGHQQPSLATPSRSSEDDQKLADELAAIQASLGGLMEGLTTWRMKFERTFIAS